MLRRLHSEQPESFAFTPENLAWARAQMTKFPEGRQASAVIPLLWRAQEQEGWLTKPAIEYVADMLGMAYIRALEVATFYFMFQLQPVGSVAHVQVCGTTSCMICGAEDLIAVCKKKIAPEMFALSADGKFSWEEVECLGSCSNAPMAQIGKDYYEDLTAEGFAGLLDALARGEVPTPGPQNGRYAAEPLGGVTSLTAYAEPTDPLNASAALAARIGDTVKRIQGDEVPLRAAWLGEGEAAVLERPASDDMTRHQGRPVDATGITRQEAPAISTGKPEAAVEISPAAPSVTPVKPALYTSRPLAEDDLKQIKGVGPKLEEALHGLGVYHYAQIAAWTPAELAWIDENLGSFKGRASRDEWVAKAQALMNGTGA